VSKEWHRARVIAAGNIGGMGAALWLVGAQEWMAFGWFFDPAVAKVGKAIFFLSLPVSVWFFASAVYAGAIPEDK
jgi:hypothetical protein